eukprot:TRINITY_DN11657_c0_g1_i1.p1 TRINITY_DN11657_c0_g1~~TRINITY_DN11657_c0_g1_i1.p1  ORF type:complete len:1182 (-),score=509.15 TRINITY_DN11657_c0_g1_i1:235-3780(-)
MIVERFRGKNVYITGATGFVGKIIVEKLLRSCPGIGDIYLLIRPGKKMGPEERLKKLMTESRVFDRIRREQGDEGFERLAEKVKAVSGDVGKDELGMSPEDIEVVTENVSVFIHSAATINFNEPMHVAVNLNTLGTLRVLSLAKRCRRLDAFTHISTAYVNCNKKGTIEEKLYPLDYDPEDMLKKLLDTDPAELERMTPRLLDGYPNTYTFTKSLTEHLLWNRRHDIPLFVFRPSIIGASYKEPSPGWLDAISAASSLYLTAGVGVMKFVLARRPDRIGDQVPADTVVNSVIAGTADIMDGQNRFNVVQCGTSKNKPLTWAFVRKVILPYIVRKPPRRVFSKPDFNFVTSDTLYHIMYFLQYRVPVVAFKAYANTLGTEKQRKQAKTYESLSRRVGMIADNFEFFVNNEWIFDTANTYAIWEKMSPQEQIEFNFDMRQIDWEEYLLTFVYGMKTHILKEQTVYPLLDRSMPIALRRDFMGDFWWASTQSRGVNDVYKTHPPEMLPALVLRVKRVRDAVMAEAERDGVPVKQVEDRAREILERMQGTIHMPVLRTQAYFFRKIYRHLYRAVCVDQLGLRRVKHAAKSAPIIIVPTHRSYIDFLLMSYIFFEHGLPLPRIAAGDDFLNMFFVRWLFRNSGAFFMRRSFAKDDLYRQIFSEYVQQVLHQGHPLEFFVEGTRSRSNKCLTPKLGMVGYATDAVLSGDLENVHICPISMSYQRIVEEEGHTRELSGEAKTKPTTAALIQATFSKLISLDLGRISVQFAEPISLRDYIAQQQRQEKRHLPYLSYRDPLRDYSSTVAPHDLPDYLLASSDPATGLPPLPPLDRDQRNELNRSLAYRIIHSFHEEMMCMTTSVVATLLMVYRNGISRDTLVEKYAWLCKAITARGTRIDPVETDDLQTVQDALGLLSYAVVEHRNIVEICMERREDFKNALQVSLYRNALMHVFQREACVVLSILSLARPHARLRSPKRPDLGLDVTHASVSKRALLDRHAFLSEMFVHEFVDALRDEEIETTLNVMVARGILAMEADESGDMTVSVQEGGRDTFNFLLELTAPFVDSYWVAIASLSSLLPSRSLVERLLCERMQWFAEKLYTEQLLPFYESCSKDSLRNAILWLRACGVLCVNESSALQLTPEYTEQEKLIALMDHTALFRKPTAGSDKHSAVAALATRLGVPLLSRL